MDLTTKWGSRSMHSFNPGFPAICPPSDAKPVDTEVFRLVMQDYPSANDFLSHREIGKRCECDECECWGLSVWCSRPAVDHALKVIPYFRKKCIAKGRVAKSNGVIKHTPTNKQPCHYTFWKDKNSKLEEAFKVVIYPKKAVK